MAALFGEKLDDEKFDKKIHMTTVVLVNAWHDDNKGDSAITLATLHLLRQRWPGAALRVCSLLDARDPAYAGAYRHVRDTFPDVAVAGSPCPAYRTDAGLATALLWAVRVAFAWLLVITHLARRGPPSVTDADLVVVQGGSAVFDSGRAAWAGLPRLAQVLFPAWVAERAGVPTVFLGHTLGPLRSRLATRLTARVLRRATAVVVREPESLATALELGVDPARAVLAADLAFALVPAATDPVDRVVCERWLAGHRLLVIAARRHPYLEDEAARRLVAEVAAAARALLGRGVVTRVAVVAHTLGPTPVEDDRPAAAAIASAIGRRAVFIDDDLGPQELASLYGRAAVVVAVRLHAAILSMVGGTPAVVISYFTAKAPGVMAGLGAAASVADYDAVDADTLRRDVEALVRSTGTRTWVTEAVAASRQKLDDALDVVEQLLAADLARQADKAAKADKADLLAGERLEETGAAA